MTDEELADKYAEEYFGKRTELVELWKIKSYKNAFLAGLKAGRPQWHKIFESEPYSYEYWDLPQDNLPKIENFYFVKLKNGFVKICELKYDHWSRKKYFYDLHGGKQSNVAEWLDYPTCDKEAEEYREQWQNKGYYFVRTD